MLFTMFLKYSMQLLCCHEPVVPRRHLYSKGLVHPCVDPLVVAATLKMNCDAGDRSASSLDLYTLSSYPL